MSTDDPKVFAFPSADTLPTNPLTIEQPQRYTYCDHEEVSLDEHLRTVNCKLCGAVLDPFGFLQKNARTLQMAWQNHRSVNAKVSEVRERLENLEKERKRLSAQVKRLQEKAAPSLSVRGKELL